MTALYVLIAVAFFVYLMKPRGNRQHQRGRSPNTSAGGAPSTPGSAMTLEELSEALRTQRFYMFRSWAAFTLWRLQNTFKFLVLVACLAGLIVGIALWVVKTTGGTISMNPLHWYLAIGYFYDPLLYLSIIGLIGGALKYWYGYPYNHFAGLWVAILSGLILVPCVLAPMGAVSLAYGELADPGCKAPLVVHPIPDTERKFLVCAKVTNTMKKTTFWRKSHARLAVDLSETNRLFVFNAPAFAGIHSVHFEWYKDEATAQAHGKKVKLSGTWVASFMEPTARSRTSSTGAAGIRTKSAEGAWQLHAIPGTPKSFTGWMIVPGKARRRRGLTYNPRRRRNAAGGGQTA